MSQRPKLFRFLVTIPAYHCPSPVAADARDEVQLLLSRHMDKVKVRTLTQKEIIYAPLARTVTKRLK